MCAIDFGRIKPMSHDFGLKNGWGNYEVAKEVLTKLMREMQYYPDSIVYFD